MGHNIMHRTCKDTDAARKYLEAELNEYVSHATWQEGGSGLDRPIRWIKERICDSREEAEKYIDEHDRGWYDQLAVRYRDYSKQHLTSKTLETLTERAQRLGKRYYELQDKVHYEGIKSKLISCRNCESKLASSYCGKTAGFKNECPVCGADLRPESTLKLIEAAKKNADKAAKDKKAEIKKLQEKAKKRAEIKWLVKVEYHT